MGLLSRKKAANGGGEQADSTSPVQSAAQSMGEEDKHDENSEQDDSKPDNQVSENALIAEEKRVEAIEAGPGEDEDAEKEYPKAGALALIVAALLLAVFCVALDNTIISTAIPKITDEFHAVQDVGWYGSAYLLTTCAFQLFFGKCYTFFSIKYVFLAAILVFEIGSAVCGAAPSSIALIVGRAIAGVGSAGVFSGAFLIIANTVPLRKRPAYIGLIGAVYGVASVAGPLMGGAFTSDVTWRWCFYINLPIGGATMLFIFIFYRPTTGARAQKLENGWRSLLNQFDPIGLILLLAMVICLLLALQWGGSTYPWSNGRIIALFVVFGVLLIAFIGVQFWKGDNATVPPRILKQRSIAAGCAFQTCIGGCFFIFVYYIAIWFQAVKGVSPVESGIRNIPVILSLVIISMVSGIIVTAVGYYAQFYLISSVVMTVGAGLMSTFNEGTPESQWIGYQILLGIGIGFGLQQSFVMAQTVLRDADIPIGTALVIFFQLLGGAIFVAVGQSVFTNGIVSNIPKYAPEVSAAKVLSLGATALKGSFPSQDLPGIIKAYNAAIIDTFYVAVAMAAATIFGAVFIEWKSVKGPKVETSAA